MRKAKSKHYASTSHASDERKKSSVFRDACEGEGDRRIGKISIIAIYIVAVEGLAYQ